MITIYVDNKEIKVEKGKTLLSVLLDNGIKIRDNCEGNGACGTCQVSIDSEHYNKLDISDEELDVIDKQINKTPTSRLACQVIVEDGLDGANIEVL